MPGRSSVGAAGPLFRRPRMPPLAMPGVRLCAAIGSGQSGQQTSPTPCAVERIETGLSGPLSCPQLWHGIGRQAPVCTLSLSTGGLCRSCTPGAALFCPCCACRRPPLPGHRAGHKGRQGPLRASMLPIISLLPVDGSAEKRDTAPVAPGGRANAKSS